MCRDPKSGKCVSKVKALHAAQITSVTCSVDGATLLTCGRDSVLRVSDARSLRPKTTTATTTTTSNRQNPSSSDSPCPPMSDPAFVVTSVWCSAALGPDGKHAAAASGDGGGGLFVWETGTGRRVRRLLVSSSSGGGGGSSSASSSGVAAAAPGGALAVAWSPQGSPLACCDRGGGVSLWAPRGG